MKHKISKLIITLGILATLPACIEVKDKDEEGNVVIQTIEGDDLVVDEPLFLHEGQFLRQDAFQQIRGEPPPSQDYEFKFRNLKIGPKGVLYSMGNNLRIKVHSLSSVSGQIASFPSGARSSVGAGRAGGYILIAATSAEGVFKAIMRGEQGKAGAKKVNGSAGGDSGILEISAESASLFKPSVDILPRAGGEEGPVDLGFEGGGLKIKVQASLPGAPGKKQTACISIQKNMQCQAESFSYSR